MKKISMGTTLPSGKRELTLSSDVTVSMGGTKCAVQEPLLSFLINLEYIYDKKVS